MKKFCTVHYEIGRKTERSPLVFAHLSDLHGCFYGENQEELLDTLIKISPDLIVVTGDMIVGKPSINKKLFAFFRTLTEQYPVFFCNGNHETRYGENKEFRMVYKHFLYGLQKNGVTLLNNKTVSFEKNGRALSIAGFEAGMEYYGRFSRKIPSKEEIFQKLGAPKKDREHVLLAHNPMFFSVYQAWGADLTFSGHLHGGFLKIPGIGGVISPQFHLFPKYDRGIFEENGHFLCVSAGLGDHTISPRLFNPADLPVVTWY